MAIFDVAQICLNGHVINRSHIEYPDYSKHFCDECGAITIISCPNCNKQIRGARRDDIDFERIPAPKFCEHCGLPFPWTEKRLKATKELLDDLDHLSNQEKEILEASIIELVKDSPATPLAISRFQKIVSKISPVAASILKELIIDILSDTAKRLLYTSP